ncbi:hypothetical protein OIDMADRAFT_106443 [Oidiodendron maius Zn]|uniref:AAA+ ATPase domain-containing protein n=1 Tax=Oidiodendron maius (strain Zn) TaxID=913774 RepID=A0A0C3C9B4_OIDMZ|nr:hypothetical protein OIDMADRAFT_106443 [Oidiodendron maius Zn]
MIDFHMYQQLHKDSPTFKRSYPNIDDLNCERMDSEMMDANEPPTAPHIYVFPNTILGYNLRSKKWVDLDVDLIQEVTWNKVSFEHLVLDTKTKDLITALVTNEVELERGADIIHGKGNGLIILLHGAPGTGKTFTAESVAELAERPLFQVTCGDMGTSPKEVEEYMNSILRLGRNWNCVVLLDEADTFLEHRTSKDVVRNALVSVFLRVLEYYDGILILTSNRVGSFDEAFKSRIQLALQYSPLTKAHRREIWKNFLSRLEDINESPTSSIANLTEPGSRKRKFAKSSDIDFDDIDRGIDDLAGFQLNGRQIRNVITTARQLATYKGERMMYHHLHHTIAVSNKFDNYLLELHDGLSDDQLARESGIR